MDVQDQTMDHGWIQEEIAMDGRSMEVMAMDAMDHGSGRSCAVMALPFGDS